MLSSTTRCPFDTQDRKERPLSAFSYTLRASSAQPARVLCEYTEYVLCARQAPFSSCNLLALEVLAANTARAPGG